MSSSYFWVLWVLHCVFKWLFNEFINLLPIWHNPSCFVKHLNIKISYWLQRMYSKFSTFTFFMSKKVCGGGVCVISKGNYFWCQNWSYLWSKHTITFWALSLKYSYSYSYSYFYSTTKHEIIQIKNHNLLCSLNPPNQSWLFWLVGPF